MLNSALTLDPIPCGGAAIVNYQTTDSGPWTLSRSALVSGVATMSTVLASGTALPNGRGRWLDIGDGTAVPLLQSGTYQYAFTTASGTATATLAPGNEIQLIYDDYTDMLIRLLKAGLSALTPPDGIAFPNKANVIHAMPLTATPALPIVSVSEELMQQAQVKIGPATNDSIFRNSYVAACQVDRRFRITVMATTPAERDFLKFAVLGIFQTIVGPVLGRLGQNVSHHFQAASNQRTEKDMGPGFYYCDVALSFTGVFSTEVKTGFPIVEEFVIASDLDGVVGND